MIARHLLTITALLFFALLDRGAIAQQSTTRFSISTSANYYPEFKLNNKNIGPATSYGAAINYYDPAGLPFEYGLHFSAGYNKAVAFSYGISFSHILSVISPHQLKIGFNLDRIEMKEYRFDDFVGGIREDDTHESLQPFVEWETPLSNILSVKFNINYRILRSETDILVEQITQEPVAGGGTLTRFRAKYKETYYSAGLSFGLGVQLSF